MLAYQRPKERRSQNVAICGVGRKKGSRQPGEEGARHLPSPTRECGLPGLEEMRMQVPRPQELRKEVVEGGRGHRQDPSKAIHP